MNNKVNRKEEFSKYNLSFYYKSTIIYFIVLILYGVIRGEFVEDSFTLITRDPILYFLGNNIDYISCSFALQSD